jgi:DNA-binding NarL/FixJ family response regulator
MAMLQDDRWDLALVDVSRPDHGGIELGGRILKELPGLRVVAITGFLDPASMKHAIAMGFHGYLTKDTPIEDFVRYLRAVADGQVVVPCRAVSTVRTDVRSSEEIAAARLAAQLTSREREVLGFLAEARSSDSIADLLSISANTVRTHVQNIMAKLEVHSRLEAVAFAVRHRLAEPRLSAEAVLQVAS